MKRILRRDVPRDSRYDHMLQLKTRKLKKLALLALIGDY